MKIKVKAFQKYGKPVEEPEEFEFCCWLSLFEWLSKNKNLYSCEKCKERIEQTTKRMANIKDI